MKKRKNTAMISTTDNGKGPLFLSLVGVNCQLNGFPVIKNSNGKMVINLESRGKNNFINFFNHFLTATYLNTKK